MAGLQPRIIKGRVDGSILESWAGESPATRNFRRSDDSPIRATLGAFTYREKLPPLPCAPSALLSINLFSG